MSRFNNLIIGGVISGGMQMIQRLNNSHNRKVIEYLHKEKEVNIFLLSDIERFGYDSYFFSIYGGIDENGDIKGILLKCFEFIIFYAYDEFNVDEFAKFINDSECEEICGKSEVLEKLEPKINLKRYRKVNIFKLVNTNLLPSYKEDNIKLRKIRFGNLNKVVRLYEEIDEFEVRRAEMEAKHKAKIDEDVKNYESTMKELEMVLTAMCNYVRQNGNLDANDKSVMSRRGILLTGKGGIGKTNTLKRVLKNKNMVLNRDYVWAGSGNSTADSVYQLMYEYNGKLIVFDDSPNLFDGDYRVSMWKNALQTDIEDCLIGYPGKESKLRVYNVRRLKGDRQKQYYTEIGRKSADDKTDFYKKEMKKYSLYYSPSAPGGVASQEDADQELIDLYMSKIDDSWKDEEENTQPSMPNEFIFTGCVVIISNLERDGFINEVGKGNWDAISSRFDNYDISPYSETLWRVMKKKILDEFENKSIPDDKCIIPRDMVEEFIEEVETLLADPNYQSINWRTLTMFHDVLNGAPGRATWKSKLRRELSRK